LAEVSTLDLGLSCLLWLIWSNFPPKSDELWYMRFLLVSVFVKRNGRRTHVVLALRNPTYVRVGFQRL